MSQEYMSRDSRHTVRLRVRTPRTVDVAHTKLRTGPGAPGCVCAASLFTRHTCNRTSLCTRASCTSVMYGTRVSSCTRVCTKSVVPFQISLQNLSGQWHGARGALRPLGAVTGVAYKPHRSPADPRTEPLTRSGGGTSQLPTKALNTCVFEVYSRSSWVLGSIQ